MYYQIIEIFLPHFHSLKTQKQARIQDFVKGALAPEAGSCQCSKVESGK